MTYTPESSGYAAYPAQNVARPRGRRPIRIGSLLMIVGLVLVIVGGVLANNNAYGKVSGFQRVAVRDGTGTVSFNKAGGYIAYYESSSVTNSTSQKIPEIPVQLTNQATGQKQILTTPYGNRSDGKIKFLHYDHDGFKGLAMWQFHIDQPGTYQVQLGHNPLAASDATVAFGKSIAQGVVLGGTFAIVGALLLLGGLITLIVGLVMRRRHRNELARTGGYGAPPPAWPQQSWPQQSWPQQGAPQQGWPQQGGPEHTSPQPNWPPPTGEPQNWPPPAGEPQNWPPPGGEAQGWPPPGAEPQGWPPPR